MPLHLSCLLQQDQVVIKRKRLAFFFKIKKYFTKINWRYWYLYKIKQSLWRLLWHLLQYLLSECLWFLLTIYLLLIRFVQLLLCVFAEIKDPRGVFLVPQNHFLGLLKLCKLNHCVSWYGYLCTRLHEDINLRCEVKNYNLIKIF